jgi:hypothetical protein
LDAFIGKNGQPTIVATDGPENHFAKAGGSKVPSFNQFLVHEVMRLLACLDTKDPYAPARSAAAAYAALAAFAPTDEVEGMIAGQCVALHHMAMECFRRAMLPGQAAEVASKLRKDGANMARAMTDMLVAMDLRRGKAPQVVRVERVVVHEGGRAIVGNVQGGDTAALTKPAPPLAIGQEQSSLTLDGLIGKQPELVGREGV